MHRIVHAVAIAGTCACLSVAARAAPAPTDTHWQPVRVNDNGLTCFNGYAYDAKSGDYRYTEHDRVRRVNGRITTWDMTYIGRNGQLLGRKHMDFSANPTVPVYTLTMAGSGYEEGIRHTQHGWTMFRRQAAGKPVQSRAFSITPPMAGDSGFNALVQAHFDELQNGEVLHFKFVAAGRQSVLDLKAQKTGDTTYAGQPAVQFKAELDMFLINLFVGSLKLTYDPNSHRLLQYQGIGNLRNAHGHVYAVRVNYQVSMPPVARQHGAPAPGCNAPNAPGTGAS